MTLEARFRLCRAVQTPRLEKKKEEGKKKEDLTSERERGDRFAYSSNVSKAALIGAL